MLNLHTRPPAFLSLLFTLLFSTLVSARPQPQGLIPILTNQPLTCSDGTTTYTNGTTVIEQGRVYQVLCNTNILQTNLNVYVLPSLALCLNSCAGTPGCAGATYDKSIRQCTLKEATDTLGNVVGGIGTGVGGLLGVGNGLVALIPRDVGDVAIYLACAIDTESSSAQTGVRSGSVSVSGSGTASVSTAANPLSLVSSLNLPSVIGSLLAPLTSNVLPPASISAPTNSPSTVVPLSNSQNGINSLVSNLQNLQTLLNAPISSIELFTNGLPTSLAAPSLPVTSIQNPLNPLQAAVSRVIGGLNGILAVPPPSVNVPSMSLHSVSSLPVISSAQAPSVNTISNIIGGLESALSVSKSLGSPISLSIPTPSSVQSPLAGVSSVIGGLNSLIAVPTPSLATPGLSSSSINGLPTLTTALSNPQNPLGGLISNVAGSLVSLLAVPPPSLSVPTPSSVPALNNVIGGVISNVAGGLGSLLAATPSIPSLGILPVVPPLSATTPSIRPAETLSLSSIGSVPNNLEGIASGLFGGLQSILVVPSLPSVGGPSIPSTPLATPSPVSITPVGATSIQNPVGGILSEVLGGIGSLPTIPSSTPDLGLPGVPSSLIGVPSPSSVVLQTLSPNPVPSAQLPVGDILSALNVGVGNLLSPSVPAGLSTLIPAVYTIPVPSATGLGSAPPPLLELASALQDLLAQSSLTLNSPSLPLSLGIPPISSPALSSIQPLLPQLMSALDAIISQQSSLGGIPSVGPVVPSSSLPAISSLASAGDAQGLLPALGNVLGNLLGIPAIPYPSTTPFITPSPSALSPQENQLEQMLSYLSYDLGIYFPREQMMALLGIPVKPTSTILSSIGLSLATPTSQGMIPAVLNGLGLGQSAAVPSVTLASVLVPQTSLSIGKIPSLSSVNAGLLGEVLSALVVALPSIAAPSAAVPSLSPIVPTGGISSMLLSGTSLVQPSVGGDLLGGLISNLLGVAAPTTLPSNLLPQATVSSIQVPSLGLPELDLPTTPSINIQLPSLQIPSLNLPDLALPTLQLDGNSVLSQAISQLSTQNLHLLTTPLLPPISIEIPIVSLPTSPIVDLQLPSSVADFSLPSLSVQLPSLESLASIGPSFSTLSLSVEAPSALPSLPATSSDDVPGILGGLLGALGLEATKTDLVSPIPSAIVSSAPNLVGGILSALDIPIGIPIPSTAPSVPSLSVPNLVEDILGGLVSNLASPAVSNPTPIASFPASSETVVLPTSVENSLGGLLSGLRGFIPSVVEDVAGVLPSVLDSAPSVVPEVVNAVISPLTNIPGLSPTLPAPTVGKTLIGGLVTDILNPIPSLLTNIPSLLPSIALPDTSGLNSGLSSLGDTPAPSPTVSTLNLLGDVVGGFLSVLEKPNSFPFTIPSDQSIILPTESAINPVEALISGLLTGINNSVLPTLLPTTPLPDIVANLASDVLSDLTDLSGLTPSGLPTLLPSVIVDDLLSSLVKTPPDTPTSVISPVLSTLQAPELVPNLLSGLFNGVSLPTSAPTGLLDDIFSGLENADSNLALPTPRLPAVVDDILFSLDGIITKSPSPTIANIVPSETVEFSLLGDIFGGLFSILDISVVVASLLPSTADSNLLNDVINDIESNLGPVTSTKAAPLSTPTASTVFDQPENILGGVFSALGLDALSSPTLVPSTLSPSSTNPDIIEDLLGNILPSRSSGLVTPSLLFPFLPGEILTNLPSAFPSSLVPQVLENVISNIAAGGLLPSVTSVVPNPSITSLAAPQDIVNGVLSGIAIPASLSLTPDIITLSAPNLDEALPGILSNVLNGISTPSLNELSSILNQDIVGDLVSEISLGSQPFSDTLIPVTTTFRTLPSASRPSLDNIISGVLSDVLENLPTPIIDPALINSVLSGVLSYLQVPSFTPSLAAVPLPTLSPVPSLDVDVLPDLLSSALGNVQSIVSQVPDFGIIISSIVSGIAVPNLSFFTALPQPSVSNLLPDLSSDLLAGLTTLDLQLPLPTDILNDLVSALIPTLPAPSVVPSATMIDISPISGSSAVTPAAPENVVGAILSGIGLDGSPSLSSPLLPSLAPLDIANGLFSILRSNVLPGLSEISSLHQLQPSNLLDGVIQELGSDLGIGGTPSISLPTVPEITDISVGNPIEGLLSGLQEAVPSLTVPPVAAPTTAVPDLGSIVDVVISGLGINLPPNSLPPLSLSSVEPSNLIGDLAGWILSALGDRPGSIETHSATATTTNPVEQFVDNVMHGLGFDNDISTTQSGSVTQSGSATPKPEIVDGLLQGFGLAPQQTTMTQSSTTSNDAIAQLMNGIASGLAGVGAPSSLVGDIISNLLPDATLLPTPPVISLPGISSIVEDALSNLLSNLPALSIPSVSPLPPLTDLELSTLQPSTIEAPPTVSAGANALGGSLSALGGNDILPSVLSLIQALPTPVLSLPQSTVTGSSLYALTLYSSAPLPTPSEDILNGILSALNYGGVNPPSTYVTSILSSLAVPGNPLSALLSVINLENFQTPTATLNLPPTTLITSRKSIQPLVDASLNLGILEGLCPTCSITSSIPPINVDISLGFLEGLCQGSSCRSLGSILPSTSLRLVPSSSGLIRSTSTLSRGGGLLGALGGLLGAVGLTPSAVPSTTLVASTRPVITSSAPGAGLIGGILNDLGLIPPTPVTSGIITSPTSVTPQLPGSSLGSDNIISQLLSGILGGNTQSVIQITATPPASQTFTIPTGTVAGNLLGGIFSGLGLGAPLPSKVASLPPNIIADVISALGSVSSATTPVVGPVAQLISALGATPSSVLPANVLDNLVSALGNIPIPTESSSSLQDIISSLGNGPTPTSLPLNVVDAVISGLGAVLNPPALPSEPPVNLASLLGIIPTPIVESNIQQSISTVNLLENVLSAAGGLLPTAPVLPSGLTSISPVLLGGLFSALQDVATISPVLNLPQVTGVANMINDLLTALATSNEAPTVSQTVIPQITSMVSDQNTLGGLLGLLGGPSGSSTSTDNPDLLGGLASALNLGTILPSNTAIPLELLNSLVSDLNGIGGPALPTGPMGSKSTEVVDSLGNLFSALNFGNSLPTPTISGLNLIVSDLLDGLLSNVGNDLPTSSGPFPPWQTGSVNLINDLLSAFGKPSVQSVQATPGTESPLVNTAADLLGNILSNVGVVLGNTARPSVSQPSNVPDIFGGLISQLGNGLKPTSSLDIPAQSLPSVVLPDLIGPLLSNIGDVIEQSTLLPSNVIVGLMIQTGEGAFILWISI
ncbi:hypothetical protein GRF29_1g3562961 [Pseudopithomyces chartarum]|uniref:Uncharacterized protein n=1 Tax=Pseudopithomyces chartarum TaxID=1892770 RepID=A0AAN6M7H2_9PLEO|nr:hypothetical protein GRF29_1g3562961 [Pseudopithomyces chartarum]